MDGSVFWKELFVKSKKDKGQDYQVIGTGGLVTVIDAAHPGIFDKIDPLLTLRGLQILHLMNS